MAHLPNDDKNVLDRAKSQRNAELTGAVSRTRNRLRDASIEPRYDRELLLMHVGAVAKFARLIPFFIAAITILGIAFGPGYWMALWAFGALIAYYILTLIGQKIGHQIEQDSSLVHATRLMSLGHLITGLAWASLTLFECDQCGPNEFQMFQAVMILTAMAVTAILCNAFSRATITTFFIPVVMFGGFSVDWSQKTHALSALLLISAMPFFSVLEIGRASCRERV